ncbi:hypothetical protein TTHERM_00053740 (macronuclear) [Tetrahymena thermophila SB210]|uniref:Uncharacterized protein n=1 Tax=Tetrahymena thermophila (strain SB210) TaxID=312017 RepID=I7M0B5_TETTS|nr:hypothetical protein TTHERM_00053740 [Tetrahymena thermophila SB210]EAR87258.2 hypothetical protein TTHERM_00053740 [Tetrahymena thermophila SB210]|eukprot:XP_001007503.2 hypothetical protein TTHERM_00053740 [Tetrahymena thermophila SB210]
MSTIFEQPSSSSFPLKNRAGGGIKRIKKVDGPTNFYQQIEYNAERLLLNFPSKDKLQLMKLLEELDNQVEVAHEILTSEMSSASQSSVNSAFKNQQYPYNNDFSECQMSHQDNFHNQTNNSNNMMVQMINSDANKFNNQQKNVQKERRILKNLKPKQINKDMIGANQSLQGQQQQNQNQLQLSSVDMQICQQSNQDNSNSLNFNTIQMEDSLINERQGLQLKSQMSYGMNSSMNQLESKISQETPSNQIDTYSRQSGLQNQKQQQQQQLRQDNNDDEEQQSAPQEDDSQSLQSHNSSEQSANRHQDQQYSQQQQPIQQQTARIKDLNQIEEYQKQLVETIIPQLLQQLKSSSIDVAPDIILQAFKYYEEQNRRATQYDKIISTHEQVLKGLSNILRKKQQLEKRVEDLQKENQKISEERDKYRNSSERYKIMFQNNNQYQQQQQSYYYNNYFDKGGDSGMCF